MPAGTNATLYTGVDNLKSKINPQVIADYIDVKLVDAIRLSPLARIDDTLVGRPGDEILLPSFTYVGDAEDVAEGADIPIAKLTQTTEKVTVSKVGKAVEYSDEALIMGWNGDIAEEAAKQILVAINSKIESDLISAMSSTATKTASYTNSSSNDPADGIADALTQFGEDIDGEKVLVIPPEFYASLRKSKMWIPNTEIGANAIVRGTVGMVHGCQIVTANRMNTWGYVSSTDTSVVAGKTYYTKSGDVYTPVAEPTGNPSTSSYYEYKVTARHAYIVKPGALAIYMKRDTLVELDRDKLAQTNFIIGSKIVAPYVYDKTKLIKLTISDPT